MLQNRHLALIGPDQGVPAIEPSSSPDYASALSMISPYVQRIMSGDLAVSLRKLKVDYRLLTAFRQWLNHSQSLRDNCLWLQGTSASKLSAIVCDVGKSAKLPVIAFHCTQLDPDGNPMASGDLLKNLVYAFLYQLLECLQITPGIRQNIEGPSIVDLAERSRSSIAQAIVLFGHLLESLPTGCLCIIDGFQRLENCTAQGTETTLKQFFALFEGRSQSANICLHSSHKLLLTTVGGAEMLSDLSLNGRITKQPTDTHIKSGQGLHIFFRELRTVMEAEA